MGGPCSLVGFPASRVPSSTTHITMHDMNGTVLLLPHPLLSCWGGAGHPPLSKCVLAIGKCVCLWG